MFVTPFNKILTIAVLAFAGTAPAQITLETGCSSATGTSSITCNTGSVTAGDSIVVDASYFGTTVSSATDTVSSSSVTLPLLATQPYAGGSQTLFHLPNARGGVHTVTINFSGSASFPAVTVGAYKGVDSAQPFEGMILSNGSSVTGTLTVGSVSTVTPNAIIIASGDVGSGGSTLGATSGWTASAFTSQPNQVQTYIVESTAGAYTASQTVSGTTGVGWAGNAIVLKAAPTSGSLSASPTTLGQNTTGNVVTLTGVGTSWTAGAPGSPTFTVTGGPTITAQTVTSATSATVTISTGTTNGVFAINDPVSGNSALVTSSPVVACTVTDNFTGSGPLGSNWTPTTVTSGFNYINNPFTVSALNKSSGVVTPLTATTLGSSNWSGTCTPPDDQFSQVTLTSIPSSGAYTGPGIRMHPDGSGYIFIVAVLGGSVNVGTIEELKAGMIQVHEIAQNCGIGLPSSGDIFQIAISGNDIYGYKNGAQVCHGLTNDDITGGAPGVYVDQSISGGVDSIGSFTSGSTPLQPVVFSYQTGNYSFSPVLALSNPTTAAIICYTTDGSNPTATLAGTCDTGGSTHTYSTALTISSTATVTAIATEVGLTNTSPNSVTLTITGSPKTWFVNSAIGGSRFSSNQTSGLCDGSANAAPVGTTPNQHCAFNDVRYLWQDGSSTGGVTFPGWGWIGSGGDTYIIEGTIAGGVSYRVGANNAGATCDGTGCWGIAGAATSSGAPSLPSGGPSNHTILKGQNAGSCTASTARTALFGGWGAGHVLNLSGTQYADVQCFDLSDHDACGISAGIPNECVGGVDDWAATGLAFTNETHNVTGDDIYLHGFGSAGIAGPTGGSVTFNDLGIFGNGYAGWNADNGDGTTGFGSLNINNFNISWNGCVEEYPIVDPIPVNDCSGQNNGGYGDGFGTTTVASGNGGWHVFFTQGVTSYNMQDGLDALHITGDGSTVQATQTLDYGNLGQQLKVGGAQATAINNVMVGNCDAVENNFNLIIGLPSSFTNAFIAGDSCRAGTNAVALTVTAGSSVTFQFNTIYYNAGNAVELEYGNNDTGNTNVTKINNNIFYGFTGAATPFVGMAVTAAMTGPSSSWTNNDYTGQGSWTCPNAGESAALCVAPGLATTTFPTVGFPANAAPASGSSAVIGAGVMISGVTTDFIGQSRHNPPTVGAFENPSGSSGGTAVLSGNVTLSGSVVIQ